MGEILTCTLKNDGEYSYLSYVIYSWIVSVVLKGFKRKKQFLVDERHLESRDVKLKMITHSPRSTVVKKTELNANACQSAFIIPGVRCTEETQTSEYSLSFLHPRLMMYGVDPILHQIFPAVYFIL